MDTNRENTITIKGLPPYDGDYPVPTEFDLGELWFIEQTTGIRGGQLEEAGLTGSVGLLGCIVVIALRRAGHTRVPIEAIWAAKPGDITVTMAEEEAEEEGRPPASPTPGGSENEPGADANESGQSDSSGGNGSTAGDPSRPARSPTGGRGWETSAASAPATSNT